MTRRSANPRRQWGAIAVGCTLALTYIPIAGAHPEAHGQGDWGGHAQQGAEGSEQRGEGHEQSHGAGGGGQQGGGGRQGGSEQQSGGGQPGGQPQGQGAEAQTQQTETQTQPEAGGREQQSRGGAQRHEQAHAQQRTKNHERRDAESRSQTAPAGTSSSSSTAGSTATTTSSTAASAPAPATPAPTAAISPSTPTTAVTPATVATPTTAAKTSPQAKGGAQAGVPTHHGAGHADRARHQATRRGGRRGSAAHSATRHPAVSSPRALAAAAGAHTPQRGATRDARHAAAQPHLSPHVRTSPLVTTITTIADVVPLPVRFLLGLLLSLSLALGTRSWLAAMRARRLERQRGELLEDVGLLQAALLPATPKHLGVVGTSAAYRPADGPGAGGDFYDVFALGDGRVAVILGDISGHGRQALPHTALVRFTLRAYLEAGLSPRVAVQTAESVLERQLGGSFATVVVAIYDPEERTLVYACAGHPPPLVVGSPSVGSIESAGSVGSRGSVGSAGSTASARSVELAGSVESITPITVCAAPPIGAGMRTGSRQTTVAMPGRAQVCFFTDGVTEARTGGELFGAGRLTRAFAELGPAADASQLLQRVAEATDIRSDDMAACVLNIAGGPTAPAVLLEEVEFDRETPSNRRAEQLLLACGVRRGEVPELIANARHAAGQAGTAIVELRTVAGGGPPSVKLRRDGVTHLPTALARGRAGAGAMVGATP